MDTVPSLSVSKRLFLLRNLFFKKWNFEPCGITSSPGRVNLIGEHIDYMGYGVLPIAIEQSTLVAFSTQKTSKKSFILLIENINQDFESKSFYFESIQEMREMNLAKRHHWTNYILCGLKGLSFEIQDDSIIHGKEVFLLIDGNVPIGKGLSSSSSMNCSSTIALMNILGLNFERKKLASFTQKVERFIGLNGGGMDQAISIFGKRNYAVFVEFSPSIRTTDVPLNENYVFVVSDSMVQSNKNETASKNYNARVIECRLGSAILGKKKNLPRWKDGMTLWTLQQSLNLSIEEMIHQVDENIPSGALSLHQISKILELSTEEIRTLFFTNKEANVEMKIENVDHLKIQDRCKHVYSEANRVYQFKEHSTNAERIGRLMNESHESCRDLYEASCDELEELRNICLGTNVCFGSRFSGAGWGGCIVSLLPNEKVQEFIDSLWELYFKQRIEKERMKEVLFVTKPSNGSRLFLLEE